MLKKVSQVTLLALLLNLVPLNSQKANAIDVLWQPGVGNDLSAAGASLVPGAKIRTTGLLVYKENPDELIMKIIMDDTFEDKPFSGKGRNMAMWIYWPQNYCWDKNKANCDGLFTVGEPFNPASYPTSKSSEYVSVQKHNKASNVDVKPTECKAPWWIESTYKSRDTWAFAVSITCLGMPKEFGWYAFSQIDLGQKEIATDFTQVQTIVYPFHDLAANAAKKAQTSAASSDGKKVCVTAITGAGYETKGEVIIENCSQTKSWELILCVAHPKSDLQAFRNKKWQKIKTIKTSKNTDCVDDLSLIHI